jgi:hypothetical protein
VRAWRSTRFAGLVLVALFLAHDALFAARFGGGDGMVDAMSREGHGGWWTPYMLLVLGVAAGLAGGALWRLRRLAQVQARLGIVDRDSDRSGYLRELSHLWRVLFPVVTALLLVQENLEHLATFGHAAGLEPIASPLAVFAVAIAVLGVAGLGALVRWQIREIEARLAIARRRTWPRSTSVPVPPHSWIAAAFLRHRRLLIRDDPGRAPPALVPSA